MAKVLDDAEFWLPAQFLTDDEFVFGLNSPVESVVGSTETDSDEEDYLAELTRRMGHSTLRNNHAFASQYSKVDLNHLKHFFGQSLGMGSDFIFCFGFLGMGVAQFASTDSMCVKERLWLQARFY